MARKSLKDRLLSKRVEKPSGCWNWTGFVGATGYGELCVDGKKVRAHRMSYIVHNGPIVDVAGADSRGTCVMHTCDNPLCINPAHLVLGTHKDNMIDKKNKSRVVSNPLLGEGHQNAKLTNDDIYLIRSLNYVGATLRQIAEVFSGSKVTMHNVLKGTTWNHI